MSRLLHLEDVSLDAPGGRPLFRDLTLSIGAGDRVAVVGRNGVGKSLLLEVLAGEDSPHSGHMARSSVSYLVRQQLPSPPGRPPGEWESPGERRRRWLEQARSARPDLLLLDEPTQDLDRAGIDWFLTWLSEWRGAMIVVSHDRRLLRTFRDFFVIAESGCRHFDGAFDALLSHMDRERRQREERHVRQLNDLVRKEKRSANDRRRRLRKKHLGRVHETGRCPPRIKLNSKRSYAQEKQARRIRVREDRLRVVREWAMATRRALSVDLPLEVVLPDLSEPPATPLVRLDDVAVELGGRTLFEDVSLELRRDRLGITGPNGSGKTALVEVLTGDRAPTRGSAQCRRSRIGYVAQASENWRRPESLIEWLLTHSDEESAESVAVLLSAHRFPFALAERPLGSLSPGERLRAALICIFRQCPHVELLVLDEPTAHLDFVGVEALEALLRAWHGGVVAVSHDESFLEAIGIDRTLELDPASSARASCSRASGA